LRHSWPRQRRWVMARKEHAAGAAGGIVDGFTRLRFEHLGHEVDDGAVGVKLARLLVREVGELLDQVFVGLAEDVRLGLPVAESNAREVFDEIAEQRVGQALLVGPGRIAEDGVEGLGVRLLDAAHRLLQSLADISRNHAHIVPVAARGNLKAVVLRKLGVLLVAPRFLQRRRIFLIIDIRDALEEEERKDVGLEVGGIHRTPQNVRRLPEVGFELAEPGFPVAVVHC